jgi:outer membrane protein assembly factor BamB
MKLSPPLDKNAIKLYGLTPERDFYYRFSIGDSLKELWSSDANGSFTNTSVTVYKDIVFITDLSGRVFAFDLNNGKKLGMLKRKGAIYSTAYPERNSLVYVTAVADKDKSYLTFYDIETNELKSEVEIDGRVLTELVVYEKAVYVCAENGDVYKYDMIGNQQWQAKTKQKIHSSPAVSSGNIYFGNDKGEVVCLSCKSGEEIFRTKTNEIIQCGVSISGDELYTGNDKGTLYCLDTKSGKIKWEYNTGARILMTPAYDDDNVYIGNLAGKYYSFKKKTGTLNWEKSIGTLFNAAPAVTENYLIVPDLFKKVYFVNKQTGEVKKTFAMDGRVKLTPVIVNKKILILGIDSGEVLAYEII